MRTVREKTHAFSWARQAVEELKQELDLFREEEVLLPAEPGGWWHQYVCPEHHAELIFDPRERDAVRFMCPHGCVLEGEPYRGAWLVFRHQAMARYALGAAAVYAAEGDEFYGRLACTILAGYARQFPLYPVHPEAQPWMLKGRAFHQALTEAIWSTTLLRAYLLLSDQGVRFTGPEQEALNTFFTMLEESMEQYRHILIHEKKNAENNYTAWLNASLACVYAAKGTGDKLGALLEGEGGFYHHMTIGVKPDGFEFEGSTYYHIFVLRAYLIAAEMAARFGVDLYEGKGQQGQSMKGMLEVLAGLSSGSGLLPAIHDGPYARVPFMREIAEVLETGCAVYQNPALQPVLAHTYRYLYGRAQRSGLEALLYGDGGGEELFAAAPHAGESLLLPDSGFAVLRHPHNPLSVLADFGEHGGSHGHYDKLHASISHHLGEVTPELGMVPYGSRLRKEWYAETASHNTVSVGGRSQAPHCAGMRHFSSSGGEAYLWLRSEGAYEGAVLERHLLLHGDYLLDWFQVRLAFPQEIDWWYHPDGTLAMPENWRGRDLPGGESVGSEDGYGLVEALSVYRNDAADAVEAVSWSTRHNAADGAFFEVQAGTLLPPGMALYEIRTPGISVDPSIRIPGILLRTNAEKADFVTVYRAGSGAAVLEQTSAAGEPVRIRIDAAGQSHTYCLEPVEGLRRA
jgi:oligo-alginate lyase